MRSLKISDSTIWGYRQRMIQICWGLKLLDLLTAKIQYDCTSPRLFRKIGRCFFSRSRSIFISDNSFFTRASSSATSFYPVQSNTISKFKNLTYTLQEGGIFVRLYNPYYNTKVFGLGFQFWICLRR